MSGGQIMFRRAAMASMLALLLFASSAGAATIRIAVPALHYPPDTTIGLGDTVTWANTNPSSLVFHTVSSTGPFALFSLNLPHAASVSRPFRQAGSFPYFCMIHGVLLMHGDIHVPMRAVPSQGSRSTAFSLHVATIKARTGFAYVIQRRAPGGTFKPWKTVTGTATAFTAPRAGQWSFRASVRRTSNRSHSGWSPILTVKVAP
jgi:plastocyanin